MAGVLNAFERRISVNLILGKQPHGVFVVIPFRNSWLDRIMYDSIHKDKGPTDNN